MSVIVPTVERGFEPMVFWSIDTTGERPLTKSTSGFLSCPMKRFANVDIDASSRRCPSTYTVSKASDDFPDPLTPVTTMSLSRGISTSTFFRLFSRAPRISIVVRISASSACVEEIRGLFNALETALRQLERRRHLLEQAFLLEPFASRGEVPGMNLREREVIADLRQRHHAILLFQVIEQRLQMVGVVLVEVAVDGIERGREHLTVLWLSEHIEIDRLEQRRRAFDRAVDHIVFPDLPAADDLGVGDAVRGTERVLRGEREIAFDLEPLARMDRRVNRPGRERQ